MKKTKVFLIRHGETPLLGILCGGTPTDVPLSDEGVEHTKILSKAMASSKIAGIYASSLKRTNQTATIIAEPHGIQVTIVDELREMGYGDWEAKSHDQAKEENEEYYKKWESDPFNNGPPEGESGSMVLDRILPAFWNIVKKHPDQSVVIISSKTPNRVLVGKLLNADLNHFRDAFEMDPCAVNILECSWSDSSDTDPKPEKAKLLLYNDTSLHNGLKRFES